MVSANDVWAIGSFLTGGIIMLHYNSTSWTEISTPGGGGALAVLSSNDIWSVGSEIVHWDGISWTLTDSLIATNNNEGLYSIKLLKSIGQVVFARRKNISQSISTIDLPGNIVPGNYTLSMEKYGMKVERQIVIR